MKGVSPRSPASLLLTTNDPPSSTLVGTKPPAGLETIEVEGLTTSAPPPEDSPPPPNILFAIPFPVTLDFFSVTFLVIFSAIFFPLCIAALLPADFNNAAQAIS